MKIFWGWVLVGISLLLLPIVSLAAPQKEKVFTGNVVRISGSQVYFKATNAATYAAEIGSAVLSRKNGTAMNLNEIVVGDKVEARGLLWGDNSISASSLRNMSLYTHSGSFSGKVVSINPGQSSFVIQSKANGAQTIGTDTLTSYTKNKRNSSFNELELGMAAKVKGFWDRTKEKVLAKTIDGSLRLVNITFTGSVVMKNNTGLTVLANGDVMYGVDVLTAKLQSKSGKPITLNQINVGDTVRVEGKHVSESFRIFASVVKDTNLK